MDNEHLSNMPEEEWLKIKNIHVPGKKFDFHQREFNLIDTKKILDDHKFLFWLADGALLGACREHDFIQWDNEVDLDFFEEDIKQKYDILRQCFINNGFIVRSFLNASGKGSKMNLFRGQEEISMRGLYVQKGYRFNKEKYRLSQAYRYPQKFYEQFGSIEFKGHIFKTPHPVEEYLVYVYGSGWRIPVKSKDSLIDMWLKMGVRRSSKDRKKWNRDGT